MKIAVIADDFTGANDIGIQLKKYKMTVATMFDDVEIEKDVKVYDTQSRNISEKEAKIRIKKTYDNIENKGFDKFYKKIDSTLRGNVKAEIDEIIKITGKTISLVVAFPKTFRTVKDGKHYVDSVELHKTDFANDPVKPIKTNDLKEIFPESKLIKISDIKGKMDLKVDKNSGDILIFDSETDEDLELVAKFLFENGLDSFVAGSAGIMDYLPKYWGFEKNRVMMVSGSCNEKNIEQIKNFVSKNEKKLKIIRLDLKKFEYSVYGNGKDILIQNIEEKKEMKEILDYHIKKGMLRDEITKKISEYIGELTAKLVKEDKIKALFIAGGETTINVLKALRIKGINLEYQIETGVVKGMDFEKVYHIITKPGGFGSKKIYENAYEILKTVDK